MFDNYEYKREIILDYFGFRKSDTIRVRGNNIPKSITIRLLPRMSNFGHCQGYSPMDEECFKDVTFYFEYELKNNKPIFRAREY